MLSPLSVLLAPLALLFRLVVAVRGFLFDHGWGLHERRFDLPVICVGNLAVGGTGKTPHTEHILRLLHRAGYRVAMLSRGYGRRTKGFVLADAAHHTATDIGDEPLQMLLGCPFATVAVCERRVEGIERLRLLQPDVQVIVLDDAYQHRHVRAGLNILLTDAARLYTHDHLLPWGRLREPASAARRADIVVETKCLADKPELLPVDAHQQLFLSRIVYAPLRAVGDGAEQAPSLAGQRVLLLSGIAHPDALVRHIEDQGATVVPLFFPDHHAFSLSDFETINRTFAARSCRLAVTTEKDAARFAADLMRFSPEVRAALFVQPITVAVEAAHEGEPSFDERILRYVAAQPHD